jgi:hypothetical protein
MRHRAVLRLGTRPRHWGKFSIHRGTQPRISRLRIRPLRSCPDHLPFGCCRSGWFSTLNASTPFPRECRGSERRESTKAHRTASAEKLACCRPILIAESLGFWGQPLRLSLGPVILHLHQSSLRPSDGSDSPRGANFCVRRGGRADIAVRSATRVIRPNPRRLSSYCKCFAYDSF